MAVYSRSSTLWCSSCCRAQRANACKGQTCADVDVGGWFCEATGQWSTESYAGHIGLLASPPCRCEVKARGPSWARSRAANNCGGPQDTRCPRWGDLSMTPKLPPKGRPQEARVKNAFIRGCKRAFDTTHICAKVRALSHVVKNGIATADSHRHASNPSARGVREDGCHRGLLELSCPHVLPRQAHTVPEHLAATA